MKRALFAFALSMLSTLCADNSLSFFTEGFLPQNFHSNEIAIWDVTHLSDNLQFRLEDTENGGKKLNDIQLFGIEEVIDAGKSEYQNYAFIRSRTFGKMLILDGQIQSSEEDEFIYHESLVQPAMVLHPAPKSVLIIGAGEGAAAREVLKAPTIERLVMVDLDAQVIAKTKQYLTEWHQGSFDDPRVQVVIADGKAFVENGEEKFDVIIVDVCDRLDEGAANELYTVDFYQKVKARLNPNGVVTVQSMELDLENCKDHATVYHMLAACFSHVNSYSIYVPSFWAAWGFVICSDDLNINLSSIETIDRTIAERKLSLRHYDGVTHAHMFNLPKALRTELKKF